MSEVNKEIKRENLKAVGGKAYGARDSSQNENIVYIGLARKVHLGFSIDLIAKAKQIFWST